MIKKCFIFATILVFFGGAYQVDAKNLTRRSTARFVDSDSTGETWKDSLVLEGKKDDCVIAGERCYQLTEITHIRNSSGESISHSRLSTPCKVNLVYYHDSDKDIYEAVLIEILEESALIYSE